MRPVTEIRLENLEILLREAGTVKSLAAASGITTVYISQLRHAAKDTKTGKIKNIGNDAARKLEAGMNKPVGWMDTPHGQANLPLSQNPKQLAPVVRSSDYSPALDSHYITFDQLDIQAAAGEGMVAPDYINIIGKIHVLASWARKNLGFNLNSIRTITAWGDSMSPTFNHEDILFVDESVRDLPRDGVYIIATPDLRVKRLQRLTDGSIRIISDNAAFYPPETVRGEALNQLTICGRVVGSFVFNKL